MIRGTTPTLRFDYPNIDVSNIVEAYLTIEQGTNTIEKNLSEATVVASETDNYLAWKLTQTETLGMGLHETLRIQVKAKTNDGNVYASQIYTPTVYDILKEDEI